MNLDSNASTAGIPGNTASAGVTTTASNNISGNNAAAGSIDINMLAAALQQAQKTLANSSSLSNTTSLAGAAPPAAAATAAAAPGAAVSGDASGSHSQQQQQQPDVQAILMEMQRLKNERDEYLKSLEDEKKKSKILVEDKKKEMESFLGGIADYVNGLEGVKDPEAKKRFLDGIKNMANHGVPNGVFDIMVSASAQNQLHIKTIETLTQVCTLQKIC